MKPKKFILEKCLAEAKKYTTRVSFFKEGRAAYAALQKRGLLNDACAHMPLSSRYSYKRWTRKEIFVEAGKYESRAEFKRKQPGAYEYALANGMLEQVCTHMRGSKFWNIFELMAVAIKYKHKPDFIRSEPQAYNYANRNKLVDIACHHMTRHVTTWSKDLVMAEAAKYEQRGLFQASAAGAYKHADKNGYLEEACSHMPPPEYGFSKEKQATMYHLRITLPDGMVLYKLGITNRATEKRVIGMGHQPGTVVDILDQINFDCGRDARIAEKRLHRRYSEHKYHGSHIMKNGNTELFHVPLIEQPN